jgi:hypothetical protein
MRVAPREVRNRNANNEPEVFLPWRAMVSTSDAMRAGAAPQKLPRRRYAVLYIAIDNAETASARLNRPLADAGKQLMQVPMISIAQTTTI